MGNSGYGKTITNQLKHRNVEYCSDAQASRKVNTHLFRKLENITEDTYEVQSCKKSIKLNLPIQVGFFVHQYAKLRMLQFYYEFLDKYLDRSDFQMCEMHTDSAYIAISGESVESLRKPELKAEFEADNVTGFPIRIHPSIKRLISEPQAFLRLSGRDKELSGCVQKPTTVLGPKISLVVRVSTRNAMTLTKINTLMSYLQNKIVLG